jgi:hypothetical protein
MTLLVESNAMTLDQRLFETLPLSLQSVWHKFFPKGEIDLAAHLAFDGAKWHARDLTAKCLNVSFLPYIKFPYRLQRGAGSLRLIDNVLTIDLTAYSGSSEVQIDGRIHNPGPDFTGEITADAPGVHFDDNLFHALPETSRAVIRSLNPSGTFNCFVRCGRTDPQQELEREVKGRLNNCSLQYDKFPYPLSNIRGFFSMKNAEWIFSELEGTNDTGVVKCAGHFKPLAEGSELLLRFTADNLPLEEELRDALLLNPRGQHLWTTLRPRGQVDMTYCQVLYHSRQGRPSVEFRIEPHGDTASIEPVPFPYRLEKLQGAILFRDGQIEIEKLRAEHARTRLSTTGSCMCTPDGNWQLTFDDLTIDQLHADRDLVVALPGRLKKVVTELSPSGPVNVRGVLNLFGSETPQSPLEATWDLEFAFNQIGIDVGFRLDNLAGSLRLIGKFDGQTRAWGSLSFDSLIYKDWQFTDVVGPIWIDDEQVMLGRGAGPRQPEQAPRSISANLYGGSVLGDCWIKLGQAPRYSLAAELRDADLTRFTQETLAGRQQLSGKVSGRLEFGGEPRGLHTLRGGGSVQLRDADIYRLPLMVSLLKILSVRPPDNVAFTESDIDFQIRGNHVYFNRMNFNGDAISLRGDGEMNFDRGINLNFYAAVGRRELKIPLVSDIIKGASQQVMQIRVEGTIDAPITTAEAFPTVNQALKDFEAGLQGESVRPRP